MPGISLHTRPDGRRLLDSGSPWEPIMGYSRAVQAGSTVHVSGCVGMEADGGYSERLDRQTERCMERIGEALGAFGLDLGSVVRMRIYTTRIADWREIASVVGPLMAATRPSNVLVGVASLVDPSAMIEIEVDAWVGLEPSSSSS